jgi:putative membrane protein
MMEWRMNISNTVRPDRYPQVLLLLLFPVFAWSAISPADYFTWFLEMFPVVMGLMVLIPTYNRFRLTNMTYTLIGIHAVVLLVGAHYTYAGVPLFDWIQDVFDLSRNHYDRLGHFVQGFVPAVIAREVLIRTSPLKNSRWLWVTVVSFCLSISAVYELTEWGVAELSGTAAEAFLGTQGDIWDTQKDMALCLVGSVAALILLSRWHDRQLSETVPAGASL